MHTVPRLLLKGWSKRTKLYPDISKVSSSVQLLEFRYVSEKKNAEFVKYEIRSRERQFNITVRRYTVQSPIAY